VRRDDAEELVAIFRNGQMSYDELPRGVRGEALQPANADCAEAQRATGRCRPRSGVDRLFGELVSGAEPCGTRGNVQLKSQKFPLPEHYPQIHANLRRARDNREYARCAKEWAGGPRAERD